MGNIDWSEMKYKKDVEYFCPECEKMGADPISICETISVVPLPDRITEICDFCREFLEDNGWIVLEDGFTIGKSDDE